MMQWLKEARVVWVAVGGLLSLGVYFGTFQASVVKTKQYEVGIERVEALEKRADVKDEHDRQVDAERTDLRGAMRELQKTIDAIAAESKRKVEAATVVCKASPSAPVALLTADVYADGGWAWRN